MVEDAKLQNGVNNVIYVQEFFHLSVSECKTLSSVARDKDQMWPLSERNSAILLYLECFEDSFKHLRILKRVPTLSWNIQELDH